MAWTVFSGVWSESPGGWVFTLGVFGLGSLVVNGGAILFGLQPLDRARRALGRIRRGDAERLEGEFPREILPLVNEINALINERMRSDSQESWIARLNAAGVPCGKVQSVAEALSDPQVLAQEMVISVEHPGRGPVRMTGFPVKFSRTPCQPRLPSPDLGAHSDAVLAEIGFSKTEIAELREKGAI